MSVIDDKHDGRSIQERLDDVDIRSSTWIKHHKPINGVFRVYWKNVHDETVPDGGATLDPDEGEGLRYEWYYKDGKQHGVSKGWWPNGNLKQVRYYKNGETVGKWTYIYINGKKKMEFNYKHGQRNGKWARWYENGQKNFEGYYKDDKRDGLHTGWYKNGQKKRENTYKDGELDELWTNWYDNGQKYIAKNNLYGYKEKDKRYITGHLALECLCNNILKAGEKYKILDIGSGGPQPAAKILRFSGYEVDTCDFSKKATFTGNYNELDIKEKYDVIWCSHTLEHQINVNFFLRKINSNLKEGGYFVVTVPPLKHQIVGGHVSLWNAGLLIYNLVLSNFDCSDVRIKSYTDYTDEMSHHEITDISAIVRKKYIELPILCYDGKDLKGGENSLDRFFPKEFRHGQNNWIHRFNGDIKELNWFVWNYSNQRYE